MAKYCATVCRDDSDPSVFGSARFGGVSVLPVTSATDETHTLSSYGISSNHYPKLRQSTMHRSNALTLHFCNLLLNMGFPQDPDTPVYEDNTTCRGNRIIGGWEHAKHIDISKHFAHKVIQNREMLLIKVETSSQFTKPLPCLRFKACVQGILDARPRT